MTPSARTQVFAVVGDPVAHSLSPAIHTEWIRAAGLDAVYVGLRLASQHAAEDLATLARFGLGGVNVTLPHKTAALAAASERDAAAERIGAANTLSRRSEGGWRASNTDLQGFQRAIEAAWGRPLSRERVVLLGAGGAARAAAAHLAGCGANLAIANRTRERAEALAGDLAQGADIVDWKHVREAAASADIIINSTSLGHGGGAVELPPAPAGALFFDLSYGPAAAGPLAAAQSAGWRTEDGLRMLVEQAAEAFRIWFGREPDVADALARCRRRLVGAA